MIRARNVEATSGFEPLNRGFADPPTTRGEHETAPPETPSSYSGRLPGVDHSVDRRCPGKSSACRRGEALPFELPFQTNVYWFCLDCVALYNAAPWRMEFRRITGWRERALRSELPGRVEGGVAA